MADRVQMAILANRLESIARKMAHTLHRTVPPGSRATRLASGTLRLEK